MKQTAVEWLEEKLLELFENHLPFELLEQAKEMEKEQIIEAHKTSSLEAGFEYGGEDWAQEYYNETYKSK